MIYSTVGATAGSGAAYPFRTSKFTPIFRGVCLSIFHFLCSVMLTIVILAFLFWPYPSSNYGYVLVKVSRVQTQSCSACPWVAEVNTESLTVDQCVMCLESCHIPFKLKTSLVDFKKAHCTCYKN